MRAAVSLTILAATAAPVAAQLAAASQRPERPTERGAAALAELVASLPVTARVLMIGAHPDDEDTRFISWISRGHQVETAYLSLTRGDGGQNLIGNELSEALGAIRTEELLAARRVDGAAQYFARAYDFGFSKDSAEAFRHWPRDTVLGDMVRVVRAFKPHVIVSVFSGTARDGHGQHQVAGLLSRVVYDAAADTLAFPRVRFGAPWTPLKLYRATFFDPTSGTFTYDAGGYLPLWGRGLAEIAGESRSQHRSQAFGTLQRRGAMPASIRREASRVNASVDPKVEQSLFDGVDTTFARYAAGACAYPRERLDAVRAGIAAVSAVPDVRDPAAFVAPLVQLKQQLRRTIEGGATARASARCGDAASDATRMLDALDARVDRALMLASGVQLEAQVVREVAPVGSSVEVKVQAFNRGREAVDVAVGDQRATVAPDSAPTMNTTVRAAASTVAYWLERPRTADWFDVRSTAGLPDSIGWAGVDAERARGSVRVPVTITIRGTPLTVWKDVVFRQVDAAKGDLSRPLVFAPALSVTLDQSNGFVRARARMQRDVRVTVRSADPAARAATIRLTLPAGVTADSATRKVQLPAYDAVRTVTFTLTGTLPAGQHKIAAVVESNGAAFTAGYQLIDYEHIRPIRLYHDAALTFEAIDVTLPAEAHVAYVQGVGDNSAPVLRQLGVRVTMLDPAAIPTTNLAQFSAIVVGPRAYESSDALVANNALLLEYVERGGTMVVQYGQGEMARPGIMPYPVTIARDRITDEASPMTIVDSTARVLGAPNSISLRDFDGWVQDRSLYTPRAFDARYAAPLASHDPGEADLRGLLLTAAYGKGTYVYTTLAFFRQLPNGVPGAARLFVNLLDAKPAPSRVTP
ncbi:MAG: PIG-L family deacetylase [Gemmatimonadaceae bacterium]|nr:PIG-L family deacetylase [Gemmatimonadaceae bacterium]